jgi:soluble epoxide hydrolase/lipid-phosphate phosphatase
MCQVKVSFDRPCLQDDHHLVVPDLRGFGSSTHPGDMQGTMGDLVGDLVCVMKHAKVQSATCIGYTARLAASFMLNRDEPLQA